MCPIFGGGPDKQRLSKAISKKLVDNEKNDLSKCFSATMAFSESEVCKAFLKENCYEFNFEGEGLSVRFLSASLEITARSITTEDEYMDYFSKNWAGLPYKSYQRKLYRFCKMASRLNLQHHTDYLAMPGSDETPAWARASYSTIEQLLYVQKKAKPKDRAAWQIGYETFKSQCLEQGNLFDIGTRLNSLIKQTETNSVTHIKLGWYLRDLTKNIDLCRAAAQQSCEDVTTIRNTPVLHYATKGCEIRSVTKEDIDSDIRQMASTGVTKADRLQHSTLKDKLDVCSLAKGYGFDWIYVEPAVGTECKKNRHSKHHTPSS